MQAAIDRHLKENGCSFSITKEREFFNSRKVLEGKAREQRKEGNGKLPNKSRSLTREEEEALWKSVQLGNSSPRSFLNTMWWLISQHFGLRGCQEHYPMNVEDFTRSKGDNGNEFVTFQENPAKTRHGSLRAQPTSLLPKMFATGKSCCPVALFKSYLSKRKIMNLKLSGPLSVPSSTTPPQRTCGTRRAEWVTITGHRQEQSVEAYDSGNEDEQRHLSNIIDGKEIDFEQTTSRVPF